MKRFLMLHGINHNMFGKRDPVHYGTITLDEINASLQTLAAREEFRHRSVFAEIIKGQISGFGVDSYLLALRAAVSAAESG